MEGRNGSRGEPPPAGRARGISPGALRLGTPGRCWQDAAAVAAFRKASARPWFLAKNESPESTIPHETSSPIPLFRLVALACVLLLLLGSPDRD